MVKGFWRPGNFPKKMAEMQARLKEAVHIIEAFHHPYCHSFVKDEKACDVCAFVRKIREIPESKPGNG